MGFATLNHINLTLNTIGGFFWGELLGKCSEHPSGSHTFKINKMGEKFFPDKIVFNTIYMNENRPTGSGLRQIQGLYFVLDKTPF